MSRPARRASRWHRVSDPFLTPYILDVGVLTEIARGDADLIGLMRDYDRAGQPLVVSAPAAVGALLAARGDEADDLLAGLTSFQNAQVAQLDGIEQAALLSAVITRTGLDPWNAHVAAIADLATCPVLTLDRTPWQAASHAMDDPLYFIVIADPQD